MIQAFGKFYKEQMEKIWIGAVHQIKAGILSFSFNDDLGMESVLKGYPLFFNKKPFVSKRLSERMDSNIESLSRVPIWVKLPNFPWE